MLTLVYVFNFLNSVEEHGFGSGEKQIDDDDAENLFALALQDLENLCVVVIGSMDSDWCAHWKRGDKHVKR